MLALKFEFHGVVFGSGQPICKRVIALARSADSAADTRRYVSQLLAHLAAARKLKFAARHALPLPRGYGGSADATDIAALATALAAPSLEVCYI